MSTKRRAVEPIDRTTIGFIKESAPSLTNKRSRRCLTIEEKIQLLDSIDAGARPAELAREHKISESAIRTLQRCQKQLRLFASQCTADTYKSTSYIPRDLTLEQAEQLLYAWYKQKLAEGKTLSIASICVKARQLWSDLKAEEAAEKATNIICGKDEADDADEEEERDFKASKGWFIKFRKRYNLDFQTRHEATPLDIEAARLYSTTFRTLIDQEAYQPQQVFSAAESTLAWKQMPARSTVAQRDRPRNKIGYDRLSLLLCGNAAGDFSVKPLLVYRTLNPFCLRGKSAADLPVFLRARDRNSQCTPKMNALHFQEWLTQCFVPAVRDYLEIMELPARCLLLLDAELAAFNLQLDNDDNGVSSFVQLEFLPPRTTPLLHPVTQNVVPLFKCHYTQQLFSFFIRNLEAPECKNKAQSGLFKLWRTFDISDGINIIQDSLEELPAACWADGWQNLWKQVVTEHYSRSSALTDEIQRIMDIGCHLPGPGFADMTIEDIQKYLKIENYGGLIKSQSKKSESSVFESLLFSADDDEEDELEDVADKSVDQSQLNILDVDEPQMNPPKRAKSIFQKLAIAPNSKSVVDSVKLGKKSQVQNINKALSLSQQLIAVIGQVDGSPNCDEHLQFIKGLEALMLPYRKLKGRLLQPSIRDYFAS